MPGSATKRQFEFGDKVRHEKRPEWGVGTVMKTYHADNGQRITIRFPNAGVRTVHTSHAELHHVDESPEFNNVDDRAPIENVNRLRENGWLHPLADRKTMEIMTSLPDAVRDPFNSLHRRLRITLDLYRFTRNGHGLIDWAIAQTGLNDPLTQFNRHELEQYYDRWFTILNAHLSHLVQEARQDELPLQQLFQKSPPAGQTALRELLNVK